jgi:tRNA modification GTPase
LGGFNSTDRKTIAGIATPLGPAGIGVVRISGPDSLLILKRLFASGRPGAQISSSLTANKQFNSHAVCYGHIIDPASGGIIDEVLCFYMQGPKSFTREDVVEIQSHSGYLVLDRILSAVVDSGAALSLPGEFTKRAFLNGRIDLSQAEAVVDLINAPSEAALQMASQQLTGGVRDVLKAIHTKLVALNAHCEAAIDFPEAVETATAVSTIPVILKNDILPEISCLIQRSQDNAVFREGLRLAIVGVPNVGKSSLLNQLAEKEAAIVSELPGTTRDLVREYLSINGVPVVVCDTAGLQDTHDPVERMGILKAREELRCADVILLVLDATREITSFEEALMVENSIQKTLCVINKIDLGLDLVSVVVRDKFPGRRVVRVSAKTGSGISELKQAVFSDWVCPKETPRWQAVTPNFRQRKILEKVLRELQPCCSVDETRHPPEITAEILRRALELLDGISGNRDQEDLYDYIFSQFCVGK